jgi:hypothetical protein
MKRTIAALLAVAALAGGVCVIPAHAAPPTVTPSPGYDARLQEQRAAAAAAPVYQPAAPVVGPVVRHRSKHTHAH